MANASYAITASFGSLSTDPNSRNCISKEAGIAKAMANLEYISRLSATKPELGGALILCTKDGAKHIPIDAKERRKFFSKCEEKLTERASKQTKKRGVRLLDKAIISLPADAKYEHRHEMSESIIKQFVGDSDAYVVAAIHNDKPGNHHIHLWMVDGHESTEHAIGRTRSRAKNPFSETGNEKKFIAAENRRVRRRDYLRFADLKSRAKARLDVAAIINIVANREGLRRAETRSLKEQGLDKKPQVHEGPKATKMCRKQEDPEQASLEDLPAHLKNRVEANIDTIIENKVRSNPESTMIEIGSFPSRLHAFLKGMTDKIQRKFRATQRNLAEARATSDTTESANQAAPISQSEKPQVAKPSAVEQHVDIIDTGDFALNLILRKRQAENRPLESVKPQMSQEEYERLKSRPPVQIPEPLPKKISAFAKRLLPKAVAVAVSIKETFDEVIESQEEKKRQTQQAEALERQRAEKLAAQEEQDEKQNEDQLVQSAVSAMIGEQKKETKAPFDHLKAASYEREVSLETDEADWIVDFDDGDVDLEDDMEKPRTLPAPKIDSVSDPIIVKKSHVRTADKRPPTKTPSDANADNAAQSTQGNHRETEIRISTLPPPRQQTRPTPPIAPTPEKKTSPVSPSTTKPAQKSVRDQIRVKKRPRDRGMER